MSSTLSEVSSKPINPGLDQGSNVELPFIISHILASSNETAAPVSSMK